MAKTRRLLDRFRRADRTAGDPQTQPARVDPAAIEAREGNVDELAGLSPSDCVGPATGKGER